MTATVLTIREITVDGVTPAMTAATVTDGDSFTNNGREILKVTNGGANPTTVSIDSPVDCDQGHAHDVSVTVNAGVTKYIGPFPIKRFGTTVTAICSVVTSVTVAAMRIP